MLATRPRLEHAAVISVHSPPVTVLQVAALWGTEVVAHQQLARGASLSIGERPGCLIAKPDGVTVPDCPIRADGASWEVDSLGCTEGLLQLGEIRIDLVGPDAGRHRLGRGDYGLLKYGNFALFFQEITPAPPITERPPWDWGWLVALLLAIVVVVGGVALLRALTVPAAQSKPVELAGRSELATRFRVRAEALSEPHQGSERPPHPDGTSLSDLIGYGESLRAELERAGFTNPRGPSSLPSSTPSASAPGTDEALSPAEVSRTVMARYSDFQWCYATFMGARPTREGSVTVSFTITLRGRVDGVTIGSSTLHNQRVEDCIRNRFGGLRFPSSARMTHASFTFSFKQN